MNHKWCTEVFGRASDSLRTKVMKTLKPLPGEMICAAKTRAEIFSPVPAVSVRLAGAPFLTRTFSGANAAQDLSPSPSEDFVPNGSFASAPRTAETVSIFVVDDDESLTGLYADFLETAGYRVWAFNDRAEALAALRADRVKPDLLITDYCGRAMSVDRFMRYCRIVKPTLRILMASGFSRTDMQFLQAKPDRFIQKPFTLEELSQEVTAALTINQPSQSIT